MTNQEISIRRYMSVLADELKKCTDPGKAKRLAVELTRLRSTLERIEKRKEDAESK